MLDGGGGGQNVPKRRYIIFEQPLVVNSHKSSARVVISGVPQGSVLGPLIFLILIGDIDKDIMHAFLSSFADDTRVGKDIDNDVDVQSLQDDLQSIYQWCKTNNTQLNADKILPSLW